MASVNSIQSLRELYLANSAGILAAFEATGDGLQAIKSRTELVDDLVRQTSESLIAQHGQGFAVVALGGYGRQSLFPFSDIDLLFLCATENVKQSAKDAVRRTSQELWDLRLKLSPTTRTLSECDRLDPDNVEFTVSLLDARFLAGDQGLFLKLKNEVVPALVRRDWQFLVQLLVERTQARHEKFGRTIFHLEPNIKEAPGGLRDHNVAGWLGMLTAADGGETLQVDSEIEQAHEFMACVRTFLHYRSGRDDNTLSWEAQDQASARSIGFAAKLATTPSQWMRSYFRFARANQRLTARLLQEVPGRRSSLYQQFQRWRSRVSSPEFSVVGGSVYLQNPTDASNGEVVLRAFEFMAQHGLELATDTEGRLKRALPASIENMPDAPSRGRSLISILKAPHAANVLRSMHGLGLLSQLIPEFQLIDSLVVRDFYHRYTVDEHTFTAIENLHRLSQRENEWDKHFAGLLQEIERPEILYLALLLHDLGKSMPSGEHATGSVMLAKAALGKLGIDEETQEQILFLIRSHLEMSAAMRRDIFDPENVRAFAEKIGTPERLRLLCLLTYADIRAVNPEALTPWKAENLWRLYVAASNQLNRGVDDDVIHADAENDVQLRRLQALIPNRSRQLQAFLEGVPRRYMLSHTTDQIAVHFDMSLRIAREPVVVGLKMSADLNELSVVTTDRSYLFAKIAGTMAAWGMNIVKANAFSNAAGIVVDSFYFKDRFRTIELNPSERDRFKRSIVEVLSGKTDLQQLLRRRAAETPGAIKISPRITTDNDSSSHSTLVEVVAQDRPGLLYLIASDISEHACDIQLALVDTEGQTAIDVFYVTRNGKKLSSAMVRSLKKSLLSELSEPGTS